MLPSWMIEEMERERREREAREEQGRARLWIDAPVPDEPSDRREQEPLGRVVVWSALP